VLTLLNSTFSTCCVAARIRYGTLVVWKDCRAYMMLPLQGRQAMPAHDNNSSNPNDDQPVNPLWGRLALLMFGLTVLAFLTAIDRAEWFRVKPATGTAAAMAYASDHQPSS
jgi:hypothetical protein